MKLKLVLIGAMVLAIIAGLFLSIYVSTSTFTKTDSSPKPEQTTIPTPQITITVSPSATDDVKNYEFGEYTVPDNKDGKEINKSTVATVENDSRKLFNEFKFKEGSIIIKKAIDSYKFNDDSKILETLYYDASIIQSLPYIPKKSFMDAVENIKDPEMLILAWLYVPKDKQVIMIQDQDSVFPLYEETPYIVKHDLETDYMLDRAKTIYPNIKTMHRFEINVDSEFVYAYVSQYPEGLLNLYAMHPVNPEIYENPTLTVGKYREVLEKYSE